MKTSACSAVLAVALAFLVLTASRAGDEPAKSKEPAKGSSSPMQLGRELVEALKKSPGCLGVETAMTGSGKMVIFSWFENKRALIKWYYGDTHQHIMKTFFADTEPAKPLKNVPEDSGPIMAIASLTMAAKPQVKATSLPISQIAIEFYQPLPAGVALGGRFSPEGVKIPQMNGYTPKGK